MKPLFAIAAAGAFLVSNPAMASDWPEFLGPNRNGHSDEKGLLEKWPDAGPPKVWSRPLGTGYSAPSIRGKHLVVHHRVRDEEIVESLNPENGETRWRYSYPSHFVDPYGYNNGPRCTPLLTEKHCYTFGAEGVLTCVELDSGERVWQRDTAKDFNVPEAFFGVGSTPILEGNLLIVMVGGQPNSGVVAFDAATGKTVWESVGKKNWEGQPMIGWPGERTVVWRDYDKQASYATPVAATIHGRRMVFCLMRQGLVALDPKTGDVAFSRWFRATIEESVNAANPVVVDDQVFFSAAYYHVGSVLLKVNADNKGFQEVWRSPEHTGSPREEPVLGIHWTTPIYQDGYLYAFSGRNEPDAHFRCVDYKTGKLMWDRDESWHKESRTPPVYGRGSAIEAEGKLIVLGEGGLLGLFQVNPKESRELSRYQIPELSYPCWTAPILSNGKLYLRNERQLVCLNMKK